MRIKVAVVLISVLGLLLVCAGGPEKQAAQLIAKADEFIKQKQYTEAAVLLEKACNLHPTAECWTALGKTCLDDKDSESAVIAYGKALKITPENPNLYLQIAIAHNSKSKWDMAIKAAQAAYNKAGEVGVIYLVLAETFIGLQYYDETKAALDYADELGGVPALVAQTRKQLDEMVKKFEPERAMADSFMTLKDSDACNRAYFLYKMIIDNNFTDLDAYRKIIQALKCFREPEEARKYDNQLKKLEEVNKWVATLSKEEIAAILRSGKSYDKAYDEVKSQKK